MQRCSKSNQLKSDARELKTLTQIRFLGGCKTIGSSAFLVQGEGESVLLDFGATFNGHPTFPPLTRPPNLFVALSHAHLDHSGGLPLLFTTGSSPVYMTKITRDIIRLLLEDMIRLSGYYLPFEKYELNRLLRRIQVVDYQEPIALDGGTTVTFYDAGHIPGSASILVETPRHRILYTGDINTINTRLLQGAKLPVEEPDTVIMESTYALTRHPPRKQIEETFLEAVIEVVEEGGFALVPAFAVARAQELLCVLTSHDLPCPVYLDGMAREASRIFLRHPTFFRDYSLLRKALRKAVWIQSPRQREEVLKEPGVMVASAGMLRGGVAVLYLRRIMHDPKNAVFLVGFQIPGTPGRLLLDRGVFNDGTGPKRVRAKVHFFDFSSHAGQDQLLELGESFVNAQSLHTVHGEPEACEYLASTLRERYGLNAQVAETGQQIDL